MRRLLPLLLLALPLFGQRSTMCQTAIVPVDATRNARRLLGCGEGFAENVLWHLDRSDSINGELDGTVRMKDGTGTVVYVLDTGVYRDHVEFERSAGSNVIGGINVPGTVLDTPKCADPVLQPCSYRVGHGTAVASVIGGRNVGVAPGASIVAVYSSLGYPELATAFRLIAAHAFDPATPPFQTAIINISGGGDYGSRNADVRELMLKMVNGVDAGGNPDSRGKKFLIVAAAGNADLGSGLTQCDGNGEVLNRPAAFGPEVDGIISAGAITRDNVLWGGTCKGPLLEMLAPGAEMLLASVDGRDLYTLDPARLLSGTSYSTPFISGMAARLLAENPSLTPAELELALRSSPSQVDGRPVPVSTFPPAQKRRSARH